MSLKSARTRSSTGTSSILKKTSSLKRRLTEIVNSPAKVRFQLPHSKNVKKILESYVKSGETKDYFSLVCLIRDAHLLDSDVSSLLNEATQCISILNQDLRLFVEALLNVPWNDRSGDVVKEYQGFIVNLLSAHNYHARYVINHLVGLFLPGKSCVGNMQLMKKFMLLDPKDPEWPDGKATESDRQKCLNVHVVIKILLDVIPM